MHRLQFRHISLIILILKFVIAAWLVIEFLDSAENPFFAFDREFLWYVLAGFIAQIIDGTLGMAYGVTCTSLLLSLGVPPAMASASVHTAEVFTTGVSGISHLILKNVDIRLFIRLVIPGMIGAALGAFILTDVVDGHRIKPFIAVYLLILGLMILLKNFRKMLFREEIRNVSPLGFFGGLLDAIGGGGWGPIVTSNIIRQGKSPKLTIGTVNTAEFFIALSSTGVFLMLQGLEGWKTILGLILGGIFAAPAGAILVKYVRPRVILFLVAICLIISSVYVIYTTIR